MSDSTLGRRLAAQLRKIKTLNWEGRWDVGGAPKKHGGQEQWFTYSFELPATSPVYYLDVIFLVKRTSKKDLVLFWEAKVEVAFGPNGDTLVARLTQPTMHARDLIKWATMVAAIHDSTLGGES